MKIIINRQQIRKRSILSNILSVGGLFILLASVVLPLFIPSLANISFILMVAGLGMSMVGIYFANRWVRKPRPEDELNRVMKSLNDSCHIFHYPNLPCDHILLTPGAVIILETVALGGVFTYRNGKWKESMTIGRALRYIVEEHLGDPVKAAQGAAKYLSNQLEHLDLSVEKLQIKPVVVFTHPAVDLTIDDAPIPVVKVEKLRKYIPVNLPRVSEEAYSTLDAYFENLTLG